MPKAAESKTIKAGATVVDHLSPAALDSSTKGGADGASDPWEVKRPITIPRLQNSKNQPDFACSVNGRIFKIQRGIEVEVPLPIWEVAMRSLRATDDAFDAYHAAAGIKQV